MAKSNKVSPKTHSRQQCNDYANQHNPNNKSYKANQENMRNQKERCPYDIDYSYCFCKDDL